jgi:hypothetical protein
MKRNAFTDWLTDIRFTFLSFTIAQTTQCGIIRMLGTNKLERIWRKRLWPTLSKYTYIAWREWRKSREPSGQPVSEPTFESWISRKGNRDTKHVTATFSVRNSKRNITHLEIRKLPTQFLASFRWHCHCSSLLYHAAGNTAVVNLLFASTLNLLKQPTECSETASKLRHILQS